MDPLAGALAVAHVSAYERGRAAGKLCLAPSLNPYAEHLHDHTEWKSGWIRESGERLKSLPMPAMRSPALVIPHPAMTAEQCDLICAREGLQLIHLGRARFALVQTSARNQTQLRIALTPDFRRDRRRHPRDSGPEIA